MSQIIKSASAGTLPGTVIETITGNDGVPEAGVNHNFDIVTANGTPKFLGSTGTETLNFNLSNLVLGSSLPSITSASDNVGIGFNCLQSVTSASFGVYIGAFTGTSVTSANNNTIVGSGAFDSAVTAGNNVAIGTNALGNFTGAGTTSNIAIGVNALDSGFFGTNNIGLGNDTGAPFSGSESSNILIGNIGVASESNAIRIGIQGIGLGQQNLCFIAGITGATPIGANIPQVTLTDNAGNLTTIISSTAGFVLTSNGNGTPSFQAITTSLFPNTDVTSSTQTMATNNSYTTNRGGGVAYTLPSTANEGDVIKVVGKLGAWSIVYGTGQQILIGSSSSTVTSGSIASTNVGDCIELQCITGGSSTIWRATSVIGNITIA